MRRATWGLFAVLLLGGCSAIRVQPRYSECVAGAPSTTACDRISERIEILYEVRCEERCAARFTVPQGYGAEEFDGEFRRRVVFIRGSQQALTLTVSPVEETDVVRDARIRADGRLLEQHTGEEVAGREVTVAAVLPR